MVYSDVVRLGLIQPKKSKYTMRDVNNVMADSLFVPVNGLSLTEQQACFIVRCSALFHNTDYSKAVARVAAYRIAQA